MCSSWARARFYTLARSGRRQLEQQTQQFDRVLGAFAAPEALAEAEQHAERSTAEEAGYVVAKRMGNSTAMWESPHLVWYGSGWKA